MWVELILPVVTLAFAAFFVFRTHKNEMSLRLYYAERENDLHRELKAARDAYTSIVEAQRRSVEAAAAMAAAATRGKVKHAAVPGPLVSPPQTTNGHRRMGIMIPEE